MNTFAMRLFLLRFRNNITNLTVAVIASINDMATSIPPGSLENTNI